MMHDALTEWLLENGGPSVRYRTATELLEDPTSVDLDRLTEDLLESPLVRRWLERLVPGELHGSYDTRFETAMNKLLELGCKAGMAPFDERTLPFRRLLADILTGKIEANDFPYLTRGILAAPLAGAGYAEHRQLREYLSQRLDELYQTAQEGRYDIYIDQSTRSDIPEAMRDKPLVKAEFCPHGKPSLTRGIRLQEG